MAEEISVDPETGEIREPARANAGEYSVSDISQAIKRSVEDRFSHVRVRGEISGYRGAHSSGHCYFSVKDDGAKLDAVIWRGSFTRLRSKLQEGLEVILTGRITTFPGKSAYQLIVENVEPAGVGALMALLEERRRKLAAEGLFDSERKRPLPYLPKLIGVGDPSMIHASPFSRRSMRGARSLNFARTRLVQRSGGSLMWESAEIRRYCLAIGFRILSARRARRAHRFA